MPLCLDDFDFDLPPELIAQHPAGERAGSRLLHVAGSTLADRRFADLPSLLSADDLLVFNDTRVIRARLFGTKDSGGKVEVLVERVLSAHDVLAQVRASHSPKAGTRLCLADAMEAEVLGREGEFFHLRFAGNESVYDMLERHGRLPLPPYITHTPNADDEKRYQTVFARNPGAVAAPTAGLHFDEAMLETLAQQAIHIAHLTLHVGAGTFQPVRTQNLAEHKMHSEWFSIPQETAAAIAAHRARGGRIVAVGTTALRALESAAAEDGRLQACERETGIFITPGYRFRVVDRLLTNFHLPKSTLLMLVSAFAGYDTMRSAYQHAIAERYRFFSYGDAMLLERHEI